MRMQASGVSFVLSTVAVLEPTSLFKYGSKAAETGRSEHQEQPVPELVLGCLLGCLLGTRVLSCQTSSFKRGPELAVVELAGIGVTQCSSQSSG